jgi:hypothetical protein
VTMGQCADMRMPARIQRSGRRVRMPARPKGAGADVRMCPDSYRDADVRMCRCLPDPKGRVRMCPDSYRDANVMSTDACPDLAKRETGANGCPTQRGGCQCGALHPAEFHCLAYFLKYKFIYLRLKLSGKSVNPLNPGSNRRCGCADMRICQPACR